jgi:hypothetical protein
MTAHDTSKEPQASVAENPSEVNVDGSFQFVHEYGGNDSNPSY